MVTTLYCRAVSTNLKESVLVLLDETFYLIDDIAGKVTKAEVDVTSQFLVFGCCGSAGVVVVLANDLVQMGKEIRVFRLANSRQERFFIKNR